MARSKKKAGSRKTDGPGPLAAGGLPGWYTNRKLHTWTLFVFSVLLYANTFTHDYAQDDAIVITENMFVEEGLGGVSGILAYDTFYGFFKEAGKANLVAGGRYRPLSLVTFALEVQVFGSNPMLSHIINALFYGFTVVVLYWLFLKILRPNRDPVFAYFVAFGAGLLFAAHPIHTEVVANIKGRDEILAMLCSLGAVLLSLRAYAEKKPLLNMLAGLVFFLGLLSKENAITFLAVVPLTYYFFTKANAGKVLAQLAPLALAAALFILLRTSILGFSLGKVSMELMNNPFLKIENGQWVALGFGDKMATVFYTLGKYVQLLLFPHPLTHDYYPRHIPVMSWGDWQVLLSLLLYLGMLGYAITGLRRKDPLSYGIWFYLITLSIVSNIVFAVGVNMAERLAFMPSAGFCLAMAVLVYRLLVKNSTGKLRKLYPAFGVMAAISLTFGLLTVLRNPAWKDNYTLFTTDIYTSSNSAKLRNAMGGVLIDRWKNSPEAVRDRSVLEEAAGHLEAAVRIHPTYRDAYLNLGNAYNYLQDYEKSIQAYQRVLQIAPDYQKAIENLGITYREAGQYYGEKKNDLNQALQYLHKAYELRPAEYATVRLLGVAYGTAGNNAKALEFFNKALELEPRNPGALLDLGTAYHNARMPEKGDEYIQRAYQLDSTYVKSRLNK